MKCKYSFICDAANIAQSGNLNILGIFNNIFSSQFPCTHPKFTYVASLEFHRSEVGKHKFKVSFVDDDGKEIVPTINGEIEANSSSMFTNLLLEFAGVKFPKPGTYQIDLVVDNQYVTTESITLLQRS